MIEKQQVKIPKKYGNLPKCKKAVQSLLTDLEVKILNGKHTKHYYVFSIYGEGVKDRIEETQNLG